MANLNIISLSDFTDLVEKEWLVAAEMVGQNARQLYITMDMAEHTGSTYRFTEIDTETFAGVKDEGEDADIASVSQGYTKTMTMRRFAKEITITWEMRRLNKAPDVVARLTSLSHF